MNMCHCGGCLDDNNLGKAMCGEAVSISLALSCATVPTEAPTILLANRNRPVVQPTGPLAIEPAYTSSYVILHCLVNGLPHWAMGYLVRQQAGL
jgi:hypothetical protein